MKRFLKILLCIFTTALVYKTIKPQDPTKLFIGSVQFPIIADYDVCLYYKGQKIPTENSKNAQVQFSFLESQYTQDIYILICEGVSYQTENNTIQNLCITDNYYKCYKLQAIRILDENNITIEYSWNTQEHELINKIIPDNTLIFVFNPYYVQGLITSSWKTDSALRIIPTIDINPEISIEELKRSMITARLASIDIDTIHKKTTNQSVQSQSAQALLTLIQ